MNEDIIKEYERREEYKKTGVVGSIFTFINKEIKAWEDRIEKNNNALKIYPSFVYASQMKNIGRLAYDENTHNYKLSTLENNNASDCFIGSLYTFFKFGGYINVEQDPENLNNVVLFTELFTGMKFIYIEDIEKVNFDKIKLWDYIDNGVVLTITDMYDINDEILFDIGKETVGRNDEVNDFINRKQKTAIDKLENDRVKDKEDAYYMASAENIIRKSKSKVLSSS